jgi:8-oxo-dGTP pyrophosphatase MutT (NUDIX family)
MKPTFHEIDRIEAVLEPFDWEVPRRHAAAIEDYWQQAMQRSSQMFNGTVLIQHRGAIEGRVFRAGYSATDYKSFLGFLRLDIGSPGVRNGFGMAALRASDGAFLMGQMGPGTANAGMVYFAAGTPDMSDVVEGRVDLAGSVIREMCEETGLTEDEVRVGEGWTVIFAPKRVAFMRPVTIDLPAEVARARMLERMKTLKEDELSDIVIVRPDDPLTDTRMPEFVLAYLHRAFGRAGPIA